MNKANLNAKYREYVRNNLSPTERERIMVGKISDAINVALGNKSLLIGSYARFTAGRPLHDLDVLFLAGNFDPHHLSPHAVLTSVRSMLEEKFENPTNYRIAISEQSHSITVAFLDGKNEVFAVDIVPAFASGSKNEFGDDIYWVPEIILLAKRQRQVRYEQLAKVNRPEIEWWLKSDPRGYIRATTELNKINSDFRKVAKFVKRWKHNCCEAHADFKLKSFHIEQALFHIYSRTPRIEFADAIFELFCAIPEIIVRPQIRDRADQTRFIDEYLNDLSPTEKQTIIEARDFLLITLEYLADTSDVSVLLGARLHKRASSTERYLFDSRIPVFLEAGRNLTITGNVLPRDGFRPFILDMLGIINVDRRIRFVANVAQALKYDLLKWKVKNDNSSPQPRGEITDHSTRNNPERTQYKGSHFVECYAVKDNVCVARARQNVVLKSV